MKCPYCGGEVSSQESKCPFCGRENPEGAAFQAKINRKIERNRLLKPFLIKQKTPELVQKMLNRILLIIIGINVVLVVFSIGIYLWADSDADRAERNPAPGSHAEQYEEAFLWIDDYSYSFFFEIMQDFFNDVESGQLPDQEEISTLVDYAYSAAEGLERETEENRKTAMTFIHAFFNGYLRLSEEETAFLEPDENGEYDRYPDEALAERAVTAIERRLLEVQSW
ncbi:MAG: hypothetical protein UFG06_06380 [Lachnospiraceae bacterium]|nr:hypothetical protein [Lachnospiraceae bacterium]